jgi:hypothetical protein
MNVISDGVYCWEFIYYQPYIQFGVAKGKFMDKPGPISVSKGAEFEVLLFFEFFVEFLVC